MLYAELLRSAGERGFRRAFAGIAQPNEASNALHQAFGFRPAGHYRRRIGMARRRRWHDCASGRPARPARGPMTRPTPHLRPTGYLSSEEDRPSSRRATTSCWICWVPSKMSRILESRAHFSSSDLLGIACGAGQFDGFQGDVAGHPAGLGLAHRRFFGVGNACCRPAMPHAGSAGSWPPSRPPSAGTRPRRRFGRVTVGRRRSPRRHW